MSPPVIPIGNREPTPCRSVFPEGAGAIIFRPSRSALTSGNARTRDWKLRFERRTAPFIEPLTGWTGGDDPLAYVELSFPTLESAVAYARREGLHFRVERPKPLPQLGLVDTLAARPAPRWRLEWVERTLGPELRKGKSDLDPALRYTDPSDVLADPALSADEKRDVLHRWAVDAYLIELALRRGEVTEGPSRLADVMDALSDLAGERHTSRDAVRAT